MISENDMQKKARAIAFYLPQFHPIPENDRWWGKGFTEWTNVTRAKPLYEGHVQPRLPADLGFYDLRVPETREAQASLARQHGIEGFCYWHYWFSGKRLLERPFNEVLSSGKPDFPFCLAWANATWSGIWHGNPEKALIKQEYPGIDDHRAHFESLIEAFTDERYIKVDGKPVFLVFHPVEFPDPQKFTEIWREHALEHGLSGLHLVGIAHPSWDPLKFGYDAVCVDYFTAVRSRIEPVNPAREHVNKGGLTSDGPTVYKYRDVVENAFTTDIYTGHQHPCIIPNWDNTPRSQRLGVVYEGSSPDLFSLHLEAALELVREQAAERKLLFLKSWNEWAEGNYLEPDQLYGDALLRALRDTIVTGR
jgi:hypothetical protein